MVEDETTEDMKRLALEFISKVSRGDYKGAITKFDDNMRRTLTSEKLQALVQQLTSQVGPMVKLEGASISEIQGQKIVIVTGQFAKAKVDILIPFDDQVRISGLSFRPSTATVGEYHPPAYVDRNAFNETDITIGSGEWVLPGTLTMPKGTGPFPGVVMVHGSGPNDRDESLGPNKIFKDLAWGLASRGVAVLRYDKRTFVHKNKFTPELASKLTVKDEVVDDAMLAINLLHITPKIDPTRIFILGHSLGGNLAPWIGSEDKSLAGLIIIAGSPRPIEDCALDQATYIFSLSGTLTELQKADLEKLKAQVTRAKDPKLDENTPREELPLRMFPRYILALRDYRPIEVARSLPMPMLFLQGGRDYQVTITKDFEAWKEGLQDKVNVTFRLFLKLNHFMIEGEGALRPEEYAIEGHVSKNVVETVIIWIN